MAALLPHSQRQTVTVTHLPWAIHPARRIPRHDSFSSLFTTMLLPTLATLSMTFWPLGRSHSYRARDASSMNVTLPTMPGAWIDEEDNKESESHNPLSVKGTSLAYDPARPTPMLRLPPELRLQILVYIIGDALYETFRSFHLLLEDNTLPLWRSPPSCLLSLFLINRVLHNEAETALWKNFPLVVHSHWLETIDLPTAVRPLLQLSTYAASNLLRLEIPIHLNADNLWGYSLPPYQNCGLFHLKRLAARFTGLLEVTFFVIVDDKDSMPIPTANRSDIDLVRGLLEDVVVKFSAKTLVIVIEEEASDWTALFEGMYFDQEELENVVLEVRSIDVWTVAGMYERRRRKHTSLSLTGDGDPRNFPRRQARWSWLWK